MKTIETSYEKAIHEVREAKLAVYEDIKDMTKEEVRAYFNRAKEDLAKECGKRWVEQANGTCKLI